MAQIGPFYSPDDLLAKPANETSTDRQYLRHEFTTYQGWIEPSRGFTPETARDAIDMHLKGWLHQSSSLARHLVRFPLILGALIQRTAPPLRTTWRQEKSKGSNWIADELDDVWRRQWRPNYETKLRDMAILGGSLLHVHYVPDVEAGLERPVLKRWPHEAIYWRAESPSFPGGWYALTADSGLVRIVPGDGHWIILAHGERWHELGAVLSLGELFVAGKLSERDEAGLSEASGRAAPYAVLPQSVTNNDEIGKSVQKMIAGLGRARTGAVVPNGTIVDALSISSDTSFFDRYGGRQLLKVALSILGQSATLSPGANGVYQPIVSWSVADALSDKDHEATTRGWNEGLIRPFIDINGVTSDVHLVGEKYADANAKAEAFAKRSTLMATTIKAWRDAGLEPTQEHVDALAKELSTPTVPIGLYKEPTGPGGALVTVAAEPVAGKGAVDDKGVAVKAETAEVNDVDPVGQGQSQSNS